MTTSDQAAPEPTSTLAADSPASTLGAHPDVLAAQQSVVSPAVEYVPRGLLFALLSLPIGMVTAVGIWKLGFVASISSFLVAGSAVFLYSKGAGSVPRRGLVPLIAVVILGVFASFFAIIASDIVEFYGTVDGQNHGYPSSLSMVSDNIFNVDLLKSYGKDLLMFVGFAALGVFGTVRRLLGDRQG